VGQDEGHVYLPQTLQQWNGLAPWQAESAFQALGPKVSRYEDGCFHTPRIELIIMPIGLIHQANLNYSKPIFLSMPMEIPNPDIEKWKTLDCEDLKTFFEKTTLLFSNYLLSQWH
jgi:hypothetical protein